MDKINTIPNHIFQFTPIIKSIPYPTKSSTRAVPKSGSFAIRKNGIKI